ncbi:MAG: UDP-N-acetylglucosamine pyrophosphorylase [Clostridia bacterium]|nr:UDP-N-acetylglucosamine pyrophosphorylase [Clostridia bacterium]
MSQKNLQEASTEKKRSPSQSEHKIRPCLDLTRTVAKNLTLYRTCPWDAIPGLSAYISEHGIDLPYDQYDEVSENVWVHISAYLSPTAKIEAPAIICGGAKICHFSYVKGSVIGSFATVGEFTAVKNSILFDRSTLYGHNEVLSSIVGYESVIGQGTILTNTRLDGMNVTVDMPEGTYITGKAHIGSVICDNVKIGANCVINPGTVIDTGSKLYPLTHARGYLYPYTVKSE